VIAPVGGRGPAPRERRPPALLVALFAVVLAVAARADEDDRATATHRFDDVGYWKKVFDDFSAFRRDANLWFRFTEAGFDDFMQSQKL